MIAPFHLVKDNKVLLVDDVYNTGTTIKVAGERIKSHGAIEVKSAVVLWDTCNASSCLADYYAESIDDWVVFPWEQ